MCIVEACLPQPNRIDLDQLLRPFRPRYFRNAQRRLICFIKVSGAINMHPLHREAHLIERIGWLRAAVLGANDGIISTSSLVVGVAAASTSPNEVLVAGVAGLVAGATAMAAGEYVSVVRRPIPRPPTWQKNGVSLRKSPMRRFMN
jgi:hypothetical protein